MIGQVGRLRRGSGAGGNKLERFLVTDSPPPPRRSQFVPSKAQLLAQGLAVSHLFGFVWAHTLAWNPFPPGPREKLLLIFLRPNSGVTKLSLLFCTPPSQLRAPSFEPS